jgi:hypothetical protein
LRRICIFVRDTAEENAARVNLDLERLDDKGEINEKEMSGKVKCES